MPSEFRVRKFTVYVNRSIVSTDFSIGKSPTRVGSFDPLTIGVQGFDWHENYTYEFRDTVKPDFPKRPPGGQ
jgi:hypothetical protein